MNRRIRAIQAASLVLLVTGFVTWQGYADYRTLGESFSRLRALNQAASIIDLKTSDLDSSLPADSSILDFVRDNSASFTPFKFPFTERGGYRATASVTGVRRDSITTFVNDGTGWRRMEIASNGTEIDMSISGVAQRYRFFPDGDWFAEIESDSTMERILSGEAREGDAPEAQYWGVGSFSRTELDQTIILEAENWGVVSDDAVSAYRRVRERWRHKDLTIPVLGQNVRPSIAVCALSLICLCLSALLSSSLALITLDGDEPLDPWLLTDSMASPILGLQWLGARVVYFAIVVAPAALQLVCIGFASSVATFHSHSEKNVVHWVVWVGAIATWWLVLMSTVYYVKLLGRLHQRRLSIRNRLS